MLVVVGVAAEAPGGAVLVDAVLHGLLAVQRLVLVELHLGGGHLGLAALVRQLALPVRPRR